MELIIILVVATVAAIWAWYPRKKERYESWRTVEHWDRARDKSEDDPRPRREL